MDIRWIASSSASALYAASHLAQGHSLTDQRLAQTLAPAAESIARFAQGSQIRLVDLFGQLLPLAAGNDNNLQLATTALSKLLGPASSALAGALARELAQLEAAYERSEVGGADELATRGQLLREQWDARGPGFLKELSRLTEEQILVGSAQVVLVLPTRGGGGQAFPTKNTVLLEAVLANPFPDFPEVVRLGWLLAQLNLDLPIYQGELLRDRLFEVGAMALLPAVLDAASDVEWTPRSASGLLPRFAELWNLPVDADVLGRWWETYKLNRIQWAAALGALDQMLPAGIDG